VDEQQQLLSILEERGKNKHFGIGPISRSYTAWISKDPYESPRI